jgi:hypothetical protein
MSLLFNECRRCCSRKGRRAKCGLGAASLGTQYVCKLAEVASWHMHMRQCWHRFRCGMHSHGCYDYYTAGLK